MSQAQVDVIMWALGSRPAFGPDPRSLCPWLARAVHVLFDQGELEQAWVGACELVLIANGKREPRPDPGGWDPRATTQRVARAGADCGKRRGPALPIHEEPVVQLALQLLGAERVRPGAVPPSTIASRRARRGSHA